MGIVRDKKWRFGDWSETLHLCTSYWQMWSLTHSPGQKYWSIAP